MPHQQLADLLRSEELLCTGLAAADGDEELIWIGEVGDLGGFDAGGDFGEDG